MVAADQAAGYPSRGAHRNSHNAQYAIRRDPRSHVILDGARWDDVHWRFLEDLLLHGDIFVGYFESLFFHPLERAKNDGCFRLLRLLGIRMIVCAHGGDVVHRTRSVTRYDWVGREQSDYPQWDLTEQIPYARARIDVFSRHADLVVPGDSAMKRFVPRSDVDFKYWPIDTDLIRPLPQERRGRLRIVHAPNHRFTKGTEFLVAAVASLQSRGVECELQVVERLPREQALHIYAQADIVADQFCMGIFGALAIEGMALGKPVMCYLDQEQLGDPVYNLPVVNTTPENLEAVLTVLLQVPHLRERLGRAARESIERYQSIPALAEVWDRLYRHVWWGDRLDLESTRHFEPTRRPRAFTEDPALPDFWPVPVADLHADILAVLAQRASMTAEDRG